MSIATAPDVRAIIELALAEDIGTGDVTTRATVPSDTTATAIMLAKEAGVLSGMDVAEAVFAAVDPDIEFEILRGNGDRVKNPTQIARVRGNARSILTAERTALNFVQRLSGVATITASYVAAIAGTHAHIVDTRKTTPGMRLLQKRAVQHGGGSNHRFGLADGVLIKDNHLAATKGRHRITEAIAAARATAPHTLRIEVEVTNLDELREALAAGADIVMLDNMDSETMAAAAEIRDEQRPATLLEASGNITIARLPEIATTGVDLISVGAITHSHPSLDISLDISLT